MQKERTSKAIDNSKTVKSLWYSQTELLKLKQKQSWLDQNYRRKVYSVTNFLFNLVGQLPRLIGLN